MSKKSERGKSVIIKKINLYAFKLKSGKNILARKVINPTLPTKRKIVKIKLS